MVMEFEITVHSDKTYVVRFITPSLRVEAEITDDELEEMVDVARQAQTERYIGSTYPLDRTRWNE